MRLESILIDTENQKYEINGQDISECTSMSITFHDGEWTVAIPNNIIQEICKAKSR